MGWERKIQKKSPWSSSVQPAQESIFKQRGFSKPVEEETPREIRPVKFHGGDTSYLNHLKVDTTRKFVYPRLDLSGVQTKLTVGTPGDKYEQEADAMASQVMSMPDSAVQREVAPEETEEEVQTKPLAAGITPLVQRETMPEEEEVQTKPLGNGTIQREEMPEEEDIQTKPISASIQREISAEEEEVQTKSSIQRATDGSFQAGGNIENRLNSSKGGGSPLPDEVRSFMEPRFGADFSQVRVHTGGDAVQMNRDLNAQAFTHKQDVYFGAGKAPGKDALTAHELTHVVQQTGGVETKPLSTIQLKCSDCEAGGVQRSISSTSEAIQRREVCDDEGVCRSEPDPVESSSSNVVTLPEIVIEGDPNNHESPNPKQKLDNTSDDESSSFAKKAGWIGAGTGTHLVAGEVPGGFVGSAAADAVVMVEGTREQQFYYGLGSTAAGFGLAVQGGAEIIGGGLASFTTGGGSLVVAAHGLSTITAGFEGMSAGMSMMSGGPGNTRRDNRERGSGERELDMERALQNRNKAVKRIDEIEEKLTDPNLRENEKKKIRG
jgi:hypothetical protein